MEERYKNIKNNTDVLPINDKIGKSISKYESIVFNKVSPAKIIGIIFNTINSIL